MPLPWCRIPPRCTPVAACGLGLAYALLSLAAACGGDPVLREAKAAFTAYQAAVLGGDAAELRGLLASTSRQVIPELDLLRARGKQPLRVVDAERCDPEVMLVVDDPNNGNQRSRWIVVREDGQMRIDLIATAAFHQRSRPNPQGTWSVTPRTLTPAELAEAAAKLPR